MLLPFPFQALASTAEQQTVFDGVVVQFLSAACRVVVQCLSAACEALVSLKAV